jgi:hypothetical protein
MAIADTGVTRTVRAEVLAIAVRPAGGTWDRELSFTRTGPITLQSWQLIQLSSERGLPAGRYEAYVAVLVDVAWIDDELVMPFTVGG